MNPKFFVRTLSLILTLLLLAGSTAYADTILITVNETPITDTQITLRAQLLRLEQRGSSDNGRRALARDELIEEALKMQEGRRLGLNSSDSEVDNALLNIARNMRVSSDNLMQILRQNGVNPSTLRERMAAQIVWNKVSARVISQRVQLSERDIEQRARDELVDADSIDYILKEILFIIPQGSNVSQSRRTAEANQYRQSFQGCDTAIDLSMSYTDAAVIDMGRRHATQLPDQLAAELAQLNVGGITAPRVAQNGVSMLAICSKTVARDLTFVTGAIRREVGTELVAAEAEKYLQELREAASIVSR